LTDPPIDQIDDGSKERKTDEPLPIVRSLHAASRGLLNGLPVKR